MAHLTATVIVLIGVCLLNLLFALRAAQNLKALAARIDTGAVQAAPAEPAPAMLPIGIAPMPFTAQTSRGERITHESLTGWTLVAVMSPDCQACHQQLPAFLIAAAAVPGGRAQVLALAVQAAPDDDVLVPQLDEVARVVTGEVATEVAEAMSVGQYPFFLWVDPEGVIAFGGLRVDLSVLPAGVLA
jgi:hypothetical protein